MLSARLTFYLRDVFGGNSRTAVITNVLSESNYYFETWNTLRFAAKAKSIKISPKANFVTEGTEDALKHEINHLLRRIDELEKSGGGGAIDSEPVDNNQIIKLVERLEAGWDGVCNGIEERNLLSKDVIEKADDFFMTLIMDFREALSKKGSEFLLQTKFIPILEEIEEFFEKNKEFTTHKDITDKMESFANIVKDELANIKGARGKTYSAKEKLNKMKQKWKHSLEKIDEILSDDEEEEKEIINSLLDCMEERDEMQIGGQSNSGNGYEAQDVRMNSSDGGKGNYQSAGGYQNTQGGGWSKVGPNGEKGAKVVSAGDDYWSQGSQQAPGQITLDKRYSGDSKINPASTKDYASAGGKSSSNYSSATGNSPILIQNNQGSSTSPSGSYQDGGSKGREHPSASSQKNSGGAFTFFAPASGFSSNQQGSYGSTSTPTKLATTDPKLNDKFNSSKQSTAAQNYDPYQQSHKTVSNPNFAQVNPLSSAVFPAPSHSNQGGISLDTSQQLQHDKDRMNSSRTKDQKINELQALLSQFSPQKIRMVMKENDLLTKKIRKQRYLILELKGKINDFKTEDKNKVLKPNRSFDDIKDALVETKEVEKLVENSLQLIESEWRLESAIHGEPEEEQKSLLGRKSTMKPRPSINPKKSTFGYPQTILEEDEPFISSAKKRSIAFQDQDEVIYDDGRKSRAVEESSRKPLKFAIKIDKGVQTVDNFSLKTPREAQSTEEIPSRAFKKKVIDTGTKNQMINDLFDPSKRFQPAFEETWRDTVERPSVVSSNGFMAGINSLEDPFFPGVLLESQQVLSPSKGYEQNKAFQEENVKLRAEIDALQKRLKEAEFSKESLARKNSELQKEKEQREEEAREVPLKKTMLAEVISPTEKPKERGDRPSQHMKIPLFGPSNGSAKKEKDKDTREILEPLWSENDKRASTNYSKSSKQERTHTPPKSSPNLASSSQKSSDLGLSVHDSIRDSLDVSSQVSQVLEELQYKEDLLKMKTKESLMYLKQIDKLQKENDDLRNNSSESSSLSVYKLKLENKKLKEAIRKIAGKVKQEIATDG